MRCLLVVLILLGWLVVACGSGEDAPQETATATSARVERQATVAQQQQAPAQDLSDEAEPIQQTQEEQPVQQDVDQAADQAAQPQPTQTAQADTQDELEDAALPAAIVGVHKGVRSEGNVLGELDAPVLIEHFGDFT